MSRLSESNRDFEPVFKELFPRAFRVGYRILGNETDAEDAAAEALARAHASWKKIGHLPHRDAWVLRVAANVAIDMTRKAKPMPVDSERDSENIGVADQTVLRLALGEALRALPKRQREVIALRWLVDLSEADVARALNISEGTVKKTAHRGIAALRAHLGADWKGTPPVLEEANNATF